MKQKILRVLLIAAAFVAIILIADLVVALSVSGEKKYMLRYVISPLPPTLVHIKTLALFNPTMGDGYCSVAYEMKPEDFDNILHKSRRPWHPGLVWDERAVDEKARFHDVWPDSIGEVETYGWGGDSQQGILGTVDIIVSPDHKHALFFISDL